MFRMTTLHLKLLNKAFGLFAFSCVLLVSGLFGLQQTPIAHAAVLHTARTTMPQPKCQPPICKLFPFHDLYVFTSSEVWGYNGASSDLIDNNQIGLTKGNQVSGQFGSIFAVLAHGNTVYEVRRNQNSAQEFLFAVVYGGCTTATGYCLTELDDHSNIYYVAAGTVGLYESRPDGVWQLSGLCLGCWTKIDTQPALSLVAGSHLYEMRIDPLPDGTVWETVWRYNGTPFNWTEVDKNPTNASLSLAIDTHNVLYELFQVFSHGQLAISHVLQGHGPNNFQLIGWGHLTDKIVADRRLYRWDADGSILLYQGQPNNWAVAYFSPTIQDVEAGAASDAVYWEPSDHSIWRYTPETGSSAIVGPSLDQLQMSQQGVRLSKILLQ